MNKRIKELAEQAKLYDGWFCGNGNIEKFAELIVKEVFAKIKDERFDVYEPVIDSVMKHFGVE